jgi:O-acetyl-ADP-ribose deacetylase (regulator of RNase III)
MGQNAVRWTNKSALDLARGADPVDTIERLARETALRAMDQGWSGPPFNPVQLATYLGIQVEADVGVQDAQIVPTAAGLRIKYNPTQARERLRFSIAHEVAHTLFPDCAEAVRNRGGDRSLHDDWQLEMLCNIAAAEFVMPLGSLPQAPNVPSLEQLLIDRRKFDVSAEAYLIRIAKTAAEPLVMFLAIPRWSGDKVNYEVDYCISSRSWAGPTTAGIQLGADSVISRCRSIGHTEVGEENLLGIGLTHVEAVGIPAYAGGKLPRVAGLLRTATAPRQTLYKIAHGDVLEARGEASRIICQLVNDQARIWGGGVARMSAAKWPAAQRSFIEWSETVPREERLGRVHFWKEGSTTLASLVAQHGLRSTRGPMIRYEALSRCLDKVADVALREHISVQMPCIGTGAAGGDWKVIEQLLLAALVDRGVDLTVVEPPPKRAQQELFG